MHEYHGARVFGDGYERVAVRKITDDIYWITHCLGDHAQANYENYFQMLPDADRYSGDRVVDYPFSAFLIVDEKCTLLDTIAPTQKDTMRAAVAYILGDRPLDYIWISHIELPHAGNAVMFNRLYPQARLVTLDEGDHYYRLHGLEQALKLKAGEVLDLGKHKLEMIDPLFVDHGFSQWCFEQTTGTLISVDWAHNLHEPAKNQCFMFLDEMFDQGDYPESLYLDDLKVNYWYQFPWLAFADIDRVVAAIDDLFDRYDIRILAPSHGNIVRKNVRQYKELLKEGMRQAAAIPWYYGPETG
jgi:flavorubredoxin